MSETLSARCAWCHLADGHEHECPFRCGGDDGRWAAIQEALTAPGLSDFSRLIAIGCIVNSRQPLTPAEIAHAHALAKRFGWEMKDEA